MERQFTAKIMQKGDRFCMFLPDDIDKMLNVKIGDKLDWELVDGETVRVTKRRRGSKIPLEMTSTVEPWP